MLIFNDQIAFPFDWLVSYTLFHYNVVWLCNLFGIILDQINQIHYTLANLLKLISPQQNLLEEKIFS